MCIETANCLASPFIKFLEALPGPVQDAVEMQTAETEPGTDRVLILFLEIETAQDLLIARRAHLLEHLAYGGVALVLQQTPEGIVGGTVCGDELQRLRRTDAAEVHVGEIARDSADEARQPL